MIIKVTFNISGDGLDGMGTIPDPGKYNSDPITWDAGVEAGNDSEAIVCWDPFQND